MGLKSETKESHGRKEWNWRSNREAWEKGWERNGTLKREIGRILREQRVATVPDVVGNPTEKLLLRAIFLLARPVQTEWTLPLARVANFPNNWEHNWKGLVQNSGANFKCEVDEKRENPGYLLTSSAHFLHKKYTHARASRFDFAGLKSRTLPLKSRGVINLLAAVQVFAACETDHGALSERDVTLHLS